MLEKSLIKTALVCILLLQGCGYHLRGFGDALPEDVKTIHIANFENKNYEVNIGTLIEDALAEEFSRTRRLKVVAEGEADLLLSGKIMSFENEAMAFSSSDVARDYRVKVVIDVTLKRISTDDVIWKGKNLKETEDYNAVPSDVNAAEMNKEEAKEVVARELAEIIYDGVFEGF